MKLTILGVIAVAVTAVVLQTVSAQTPAEPIKVRGCLSGNGSNESPWLLRGAVLPAPPSSSIVFARLDDASRTRAFVQRLLDVHGVAVAPGHFFESPEHFRVSLAGDPEVLAEGLRRLGAALDAQ